MKEVLDFLNENRPFFVATVDGCVWQVKNT